MGGGELFEREGEVRAVEALLERACGGHGGLAVILGEPGIGKTRLLAHARRHAEAHSCRVLCARGSELESVLSFGVARQLLETEDGPPRLEAGGDLAVIMRLHSELAARAAEGPLVLTVDDAQWADEPSLRFLAHIALRLEELAVALLVAARSGPGTASGQLLDQLTTASGATLLAPRVLSEAAVGALVRKELGEGDEEVVRACARASGGNPFYLREMLRALAAEDEPVRAEDIRQVVPEAVLSALMVRLARLGPDETALARAAAVLGDGTPLRLVAALAELLSVEAERAADRLASAHVLAPGEPVRFAHPLIGGAIERDLGEFARARMHRSAA
ncbi:MAG: AAA family ATPase, partial [Actinomycetota bacterium]|nr:AAA family ATPase [Actinomycetota bacterium]